MAWTLENALGIVEDRPRDIPAGEAHARLVACDSCPQRVANRCLAADQEITVMAPSSKFRCPLSRWPLDPAFPQAEYRPIKNLAAIAVHFNPHGYRRIRENFERFMEQLPADLPLFTVEVAFGEEPYHVPFSQCLRIRGSAENLLWQKERLINLALERLPAEFDAVAWLDADLIWLNPDWPAIAREKLERANLVQLFERVADLDAAGRIERTSRGYVSSRQIGERGLAGRPGGAWAARREVFGSGLYQYHVIGGGDSASLAAWDETPLPPSLHMEGAWRDHFDRWRPDSSINRCLDCVPGDVLHLYHGSRADRQYRQRYKILRNYDPKTDVEIGENGLLQWTAFARETKPDMIAGVAAYFESRKEDD